jgi:hypothetical protein
MTATTTTTKTTTTTTTTGVKNPPAAGVGEAAREMEASRTAGTRGGGRELRRDLASRPSHGEE